MKVEKHIRLWKGEMSTYYTCEKRKKKEEKIIHS
jgi:hypothetical protein